MVEKQPFHQAALGLLLVWALIAQLTYSGFLVYLQANSSRYAQVPFYTDSFSTVISEVPDTYRESGLRPGDNLVAVNGKPVNGEEELDNTRFASHPADTLSITVDRGAARTRCRSRPADNSEEEGPTRRAPVSIARKRASA